MSQLKPSKTHFFFRVIDKLMIPLMFMLGGFKRDSIQETHPWHCYRKFKLRDVDTSKAVSIHGKERTFKRHFLFLFHAPIIGGWKDYCVIAPTDGNHPFFVGWIVRDAQEELVDYGINKLPVFESAIRLLEGPSNYRTDFFAVDAQGNQVQVKQLGKGRLGDNQYPNLRLL